MFSYTVSVKLFGCKSSDTVFVRLVGMKGESRLTLIPKHQTGETCTVDIQCPTSLSELVVVELQNFENLVTDIWFSAEIRVKTPENDEVLFPFEEMISSSSVAYFKDKKAKTQFDEKEEQEEPKATVQSGVLPYRMVSFSCHRTLSDSEPATTEVVPTLRKGRVEEALLRKTQLNFDRRTKVSYYVTVCTGDLAFAGTFDRVYIKLVGTEVESDRVRASPFYGFSTQEYSFYIDCPSSLGELVMVELDKQHLISNDNWFCDKVIVRKLPEDKEALFPCYMWFSDNKVHKFREGKAKRVFDDTDPRCRSSRKEELEERARDYRWTEHKEGLPYCMKSDGPSTLPLEVQFSFTKETEFLLTAALDKAVNLLKELTNPNVEEPFESIDEIRNAFSFHRTTMSDYVQEHWKNDDFFGYQFLNGLNPILIQRCSQLPENFPVNDDMVRASLRGATSLTDEIKKGNIYLVDYNMLDGVTANVINRKQQYLAAPLVLLQDTLDNRLIPVAIQLKQKPAEDNPIFFPTDSEYDWLTAKLFVRSAEFTAHELNSHLLRTHLLCEVFTVALLRNLPRIHPLHKLLIPHTRYTLQINALARALLISEEGVFTQFAASGGEAMFTILQRATSSLTYSSLCLPEDITARGLESIPNYYYRDDGCKVWDIIHRFVQGMISHYYRKNDEVQKDSELQNWIKDIFVHGFLSNARSGIPDSFKTVEQLVKFVTMVIFTGSAQHSAVNNGQFDYDGWPPNTPISLQRPPPTTKGQSSKSTFLQTMPDINVTANGVSTVWLLSQTSSDTVHLGEYPQVHFSEDAPCRLMKEFQAELKRFSESVKDRNSRLDVPYTYMDPEEMENSVAI